MPASVPDAAVPPMVLLPLAENALKHGPSAGHAGPVRLTVSSSGDGVVVELRNPGRFRGRREGGEGLAMVERRLALAYDGRARLEIRGVDGAGGDGATVTIVELPRAPARAEAGEEVAGDG